MAITINNTKYTQLANNAFYAGDITKFVKDFISKEKIQITSDDYFKHTTAEVENGAVIGIGTKIWHFSHLMPHCLVGDACSFGQNTFIASGVIIGKNAKVQNNVSIYSGVICEDNVFLGPSMVFTNVINPRSQINRHSEYDKTWVKQNVSIGANATIVCGVTIGEYAFIGAGAVVTTDVKPYALMVGVPAKQKGWMSEWGHTLTFNSQGIAVCKESKHKYQLIDNNYIKKIQH